MRKILNNTWVVGIGTGLIVVLIGYFVFGVGKAEPSFGTTTVSVAGNGNATAVGDYAQATIKYNEPATCAWVNQDWPAALVTDVNQKNTYALNFSATDSVILPGRLCLHVLSDVKVASAIVPKGGRGAVPGTTVWSIKHLGLKISGADITPYLSTNGMYGVVYCYNNPTMNEKFLVSFESTPTNIRAELSTSSNPSF